MHARDELQSNMYAPKHGLTLQINMNHARIKLKYINKGWILLPKSCIQGLGVQLGKSPMISSSLSSQFSRTIPLSHSLSL